MFSIRSRQGDELGMDDGGGRREASADLAVVALNDGNCTKLSFYETCADVVLFKHTRHVPSGRIRNDDYHHSKRASVEGRIC